MQTTAMLLNSQIKFINGLRDEEAKLRVGSRGHLFHSSSSRVKIVASTTRKYILFTTTKAQTTSKCTNDSHSRYGCCCVKE
jgi:hypothetical protein